MARSGCRRCLVACREAVDNSYTGLHVAMRISGESEEKKHLQPAFSHFKGISWGNITTNTITTALYDCI